MNKNKVNISIDDISPHPRSSLEVARNCNKILEQFPNAKFTLFVPTAYWRTVRRSVATQQPLFLSQHMDFCNLLRELPSNTYEIGYHGHHHGIPGKNDNDEFREINYEQAKNLFYAMFDEAEKANLLDVFKPIFRPPAWRMNPDVFRASKDVSIEILALTEVDYARETYGKKDLEYEHVTYSNVFPPFSKLELSSKTGIVYHACDWDRNYLSNEKTDEIIKFLHENRDSVEFVFMNGII